MYACRVCTVWCGTSTVRRCVRLGLETMTLYQWTVESFDHGLFAAWSWSLVFSRTRSHLNIVNRSRNKIYNPAAHTLLSL